MAAPKDEFRFHVVVDSASQEPKAVLIVRGDEATCELHAVPMPSTRRKEPGESPLEGVGQAINYALKTVGLDPIQLQAEGYPEPEIIIEDMDDPPPYEELVKRWFQRMEESGAPKLTTRDYGRS